MRHREHLQCVRRTPTWRALFRVLGPLLRATGANDSLVNYYVHKMANTGVTRSTSASSEVRELEFDGSEQQSRPSSALSAHDPVSNVFS